MFLVDDLELDFLFEVVEKYLIFEEPIPMLYPLARFLDIHEKIYLLRQFLKVRLMGIIRFQIL